MLFAGDQVYRTADVDDNGQLHITLESGKEIVIRKAQGQESFDQIRISPDRRTVGWLEMWPYAVPGQEWRGPIGGPLVVYRAGRIVQRLGSGQIEPWEFRDGGNRLE